MEEILGLLNIPEPGGGTKDGLALVPYTVWWLRIRAGEVLRSPGAPKAISPVTEVCLEF